MNVHDSERLSGSLEAAGYVRAQNGEADVVVINTCGFIENARTESFQAIDQMLELKRQE